MLWPLDLSTGATLDLALVFGTGSETASDVLWLARGEVRNPSHDEATAVFEWLDGASRKHRVWPVAKFTPADYPDAPTDRWFTPKPVIFGDMTGRAFDLTTPRSASWRHVVCPQVSGMPPRYYAGDAGTSDGQEDLIVLGGIVCEIPSASRTLGADYLEITGQEMHGWVRPVREGSSTTGVDDAAYARTDDLDEYAVVGPG